ncbi:DUF4248 domain-containing protein [Phocaeicola sp.]
MEETKIPIRCYRKSELAQLYFPELEKDSAVRRLVRWINRCTDLVEMLRQADYHSRDKSFSAKEVRLIFSYLGAPD